MTQKKRTLLISLAFYLTALFLAQSPNPAYAQDLPDLESFMDELIQAQMDAHHIPNAAAASCPVERCSISKASARPIWRRAIR
jgi:hypothetical protein